MGSFKQAAIKVLQKSKVPLHYRDITKLAREQKLIETSGITPAATMNTQITSDIRFKGKISAFMRVTSGIYKLNPNYDKEIQKQEEAQEVLEIEEEEILTKSKQQGHKSQKQGFKAETFVMKKLKKQGWTVMPTKASKSPIDIFAHHTEKKLWWGIQVKSSKNNLNFAVDSLENICKLLHFKPVLAYVKIKKTRTVEYCMWDKGSLYHVYENGKDTHLAGSNVKHECLTFELKIGTK